MRARTLTDPLSGENDNRLLAGLLVISMLLHGLFILHLPEMDRLKRTSSIELTLEEISSPRAHLSPLPPVREKPEEPIAPPPKIQKPIFPKTKQAPTVGPIPKSQPQPLIRSVPLQLKPAAEVEAPQPPAQEPEPMVRPDNPISAELPAVETREEHPAVVSRTTEEAAPIPVRSMPDAQLVNRYLASIRTKIERYKKYPLVARRRGREGEVGLRFLLVASGEVMRLEVKKSSGNDSLDQAALDAVRRAAPFAKPPDGFIDGRLPMELTIIFKLG
jgi:protein TonB